MKQYLDLCQRVLDEGTVKSNRTGINTIGTFGAMMKFDLAEGFPAVTTKKLAFKACIAENLGLLRGYTDASLFRELGTNTWNANANENQQCHADETLPTFCQNLHGFCSFSLPGICCTGVATVVLTMMILCR